jgi:hypothetical protein
MNIPPHLTTNSLSQYDNYPIHRTTTTRRLCVPSLTPRRSRADPHRNIRTIRSTTRPLSRAPRPEFREHLASGEGHSGNRPDHIGTFASLFFHLLPRGLQDNFKRRRNKSSFLDDARRERRLRGHAPWHTQHSRIGGVFWVATPVLEPWLGALVSAVSY